jgi:hypothetical protein
VTLLTHCPMSESGQKRKCPGSRGTVRFTLRCRHRQPASACPFGADCVEKLLFADDRKFSEPLVRLTRFDARDHINHRKNARWRSYQFYRALQWLNSPTCGICEIFEAPRFSSFSTQSAMNGRAQLMVPQLKTFYSIASSAVASSEGGTSRSSVLAVFKLTTSSNLVGNCTGRSAGFSPLRIRSA